MSRLLPLYGLALLVGLSACGNQPKPAELVSFEQTRIGETASLVQSRQPELYAESEAAYKRALLAWEDDELEDSLHHTRVAAIIWRTALARSQLEDVQANLKAEQRRLESAKAELEDARQREARAQEGIAQQERIIEVQTRLAEAEARSQAEKRSSDAKSQVDAAAQALKQAEQVDAARHAPGPFNKANAGLRMALEQFGRGEYEASSKTAQLVVADAQAAIVAATPIWQVEQKMRQAEVQQRAILDAAAQIPGAAARLDARGAVITLRGLFDAGKTTILPERMLSVDLTARVARDNASLFRIIVEGHTDNRGRKSKNLELSEERARAVAGRLQAQGVDGTRLTSLGRGDEDPVASNSTRDGRAENRRVDVVFLRPTKAEMAQ